MQFPQYTTIYITINKYLFVRVCEKYCLMALNSAFLKMSCIRKLKCIGNMAFNLFNLLKSFRLFSFTNRVQLSCSHLVSEGGFHLNLESHISVISTHPWFGSCSCFQHVVSKIFSGFLSVQFEILDSVRNQEQDLFCHRCVFSQKSLPCLFSVSQLWFMVLWFLRAFCNMKRGLFHQWSSYRSVIVSSLCV